MCCGSGLFTLVHTHATRQSEPSIASVFVSPDTSRLFESWQLARSSGRTKPLSLSLLGAHNTRLVCPCFTRERHSCATSLHASNTSTALFRAPMDHTVGTYAQQRLALIAGQYTRRAGAAHIVSSGRSQSAPNALAQCQPTEQRLAHIEARRFRAATAACKGATRAA